MHLIKLVLSFAFVYTTNAGVFLWSNQPLRISPLQEFTDNEFDILLEKLDNPIVHTFTTSHLRQDLKEIVGGFSSVYTPNGDITPQNATELQGDDSDKEIILSKMQDIDDPSFPVLYVLIVENGDIHRRKREIKSSDGSEEEETDKEVFYLGKSVKDDFYGLLYSTRNLFLSMNDTNTSLGNTPPDMITVDKGVRDDTLKFTLIINIPLKGGKVTLRFVFTWLNIIGYWSLQSVLVTDARSNLSSNLTSVKDIIIPPGFSYHCPGETIFINRNDSVVLLINDMQVEMDSKDKKFSDAWDCIPFTTVPIWSGLFVTGIFIIGIYIGFAAMSDIKTMDRFDTYKTKQLHITTFE